MRIFLLRHGIAAGTAPSGRDADRALTREGVNELERVALALARADLRCDWLRSSPYRRAVETARIVGPAIGHDGGIETADELVPEAPPAETLNLLRAASAQSALVVGHEPHLSSLAALLVGARPGSVHVKKASLVRIDCRGRIDAGAGELRWLLSPGWLQRAASGR